LSQRPFYLVGPLGFEPRSFAELLYFTTARGIDGESIVRVLRAAAA
jgi:hypothetical protein